MIIDSFAFLFAAISVMSLAVVREVVDRSAVGMVLAFLFGLVSVLACVTSILLFKL